MMVDFFIRCARAAQDQGDFPTASDGLCLRRCASLRLVGVCGPLVGGSGEDIPEDLGKRVAHGPSSRTVPSRWAVLSSACSSVPVAVMIALVELHVRRAVSVLRSPPPAGRRRAVSTTTLNRASRWPKLGTVPSATSPLIG